MLTFAHTVGKLLHNLVIVLLTVLPLLVMLRYIYADLVIVL